MEIITFKNHYSDWLLKNLKSIANNARSSILTTIYSDQIAYPKPILSALSIKYFFENLQALLKTQTVRFENQIAQIIGPLYSELRILVMNVIFFLSLMIILTKLNKSNIFLDNCNKIFLQKFLMTLITCKLLLISIKRQLRLIAWLGFIE